MQQCLLRRATPFGMRRPAWALLALCAALTACDAPLPRGQATGGDAMPTVPAMHPVRSVGGAYLAPGNAPAGQPPHSGAFVRLIAPGAIALRDNELLVVDQGAGRLWRIDLGLESMRAVTGAPTHPASHVVLGPDLSLWVSEPGAGRILRFARDGRLLQTFRQDSLAVDRSRFALADGAATLLVPGFGSAAWSEQRTAGGPPVTVRIQGEGDGRVAGVDALAVVDSVIYVLDRRQGLVHRVRRDGVLLQSLGRGVLKQPADMAVDSAGRVFVLDRQDNAVKLLRAGEPAVVLDARRLRVTDIAGIAVSERFLAVSDRVSAQVVLFPLQGLGQTR